jgi:4-hydroxybenzoate polyprenyltransferase
MNEKKRTITAETLLRAGARILVASVFLSMIIVIAMRNAEALLIVPFMLAIGIFSAILNFALSGERPAQEKDQES